MYATIDIYWDYKIFYWNSYYRYHQCTDNDNNSIYF